MFVWDQTCHETFAHLKDLLTTAPLLAFSNCAKPFVLETNASIAGLGAVLAKSRRTDYSPQLLYPATLCRNKRKAMAL